MTILDIQQHLKSYDTQNECELLSTVCTNEKTILLFKCNICGEQFERSARQVKRGKRFCCASCSRKSSTTIEDVKKYLKEHDSKQECTLLSTQYKNNVTPLQFRCNVCGCEFERDFNHIKRGRFRCAQCGIEAGARALEYTHEEVAKHIAEKGYTPLEQFSGGHRPLRCKCSRGHEFDLYYSEFRLRGRGCKECAVLDHSGENHPNWQGGITTIMDSFRHLIKDWKVEVLKNQNYTCQVTGQIGGELHIHHLTNFSDLCLQAFKAHNLSMEKQLKDYDAQELAKVEETLKKLHTLDVGVVMTKEVHEQFHQKYGYYNNTIEQFLDFKENFKPKK